MNDKIRPIYSELQGMLSQAPDNSNGSMYDDDKRLWDRFNELVGELRAIVGNDSFETFKIIPKIEESYGGVVGPSGEYVTIQTYRSTLSGLISRLHGTYFANERAPFSGPEPSVVSQNQTNSQEQNVSMQVFVQLGVELQKAMEQATTEDEKSFVQSVMDKISTVKTFVDFTLLVLATAQQYGITPDRVKTLFGH